MKRLIFSFIAILLFLSACNGQSSNQNDSSMEQLTINGGSVGGVWSVFTEGIAEAVRKEYPGSMISAVPGTVAGNPILVDQGKVEFAIAESLTAQFALKGRYPFDEAHENIRAVAAIIPDNVFQLVAPQSASFDSIQDIVKNNIPLKYSPGEKDALGDVISEAVFESYKVSYDDINNNKGEVSYLSGGKSFELMRDGRLDALGKMVPIPAGDILEASATVDLKLIEIGERAIQYLTSKYPVTRYTIPSGSYDFQEEDYETVNTPTILITSQEVSDETVYKMTKSIYEQLDYLENVHNGFKSIDDKTIIELGGVPLHPGAAKFFREIDLIK